MALDPKILLDIQMRVQYIADVEKPFRRIAHDKGYSHFWQFTGRDGVSARTLRLPERGATISAFLLRDRP
jgi:hypothetical protein